MGTSAFAQLAIRIVLRGVSMVMPSSLASPCELSISYTRATSVSSAALASTTGRVSSRFVYGSTPAS